MIDAIVMALEENRIVAIPTGSIKLDTLVGKKAKYVDAMEKEWQGKVVGIEDPGVVIEFDVFPTGIGQGQIVQIEE